MVKGSKMLPRSHAKEDIVMLLIKNKTMNFTAIQNEIGLSRPTLSNHLSILLKEGSIEFTKKGREKHYNIKKGASKIFETKINIFSKSYTDYVIEHFQTIEYGNLDKFFESFGNKLSVFLLFSYLKSLETGDNWLKAVEPRKIIDAISEIMFRVILGESGYTNECNTAFKQQHFDKFKTEIKKTNNEPKVKKKLEEILKMLSKMYPNEMKVLENASKK